MTEAGWTVCVECGMLCEAVEYHPFAACLMFKQCRDSATVRANLLAVRDDSYQQGRVAGLVKAVEIIKANTDVKKAIEINRLHSLAQQAQLRQVEGELANEKTAYKKLSEQWNKDNVDLSTFREVENDMKDE